RRLEDASIPLHVTRGDGDAAGAVTSYDPPDELVVGRIEKTKFDGYAEGSCGLAHFVALGASPEAPFEDHRGPQRKEPLSELPKLPLEPDPELLVEGISVQCPFPLVRIEPHRAIGGGKLAREHRLARCWQAAQQHQPRLQPVARRHPGVTSACSARSLGGTHGTSSVATPGTTSCFAIALASSPGASSPAASSRDCARRRPSRSPSAPVHRASGSERHRSPATCPRAAR